MINQRTMSHQQEINVVPLIDVLLVLIIIFMLAYSVRHITPLAVPLDPAVTPSPPSIVIDLTADGHFTINGSVVSPLRLGSRLREALADQQHLLVVVRSAPNRKYREFMAVVDEIRSNGGTAVVGTMPH